MCLSAYMQGINAAWPDETMVIRWARQRHADFSDTPPDQANPCTMVSDLMERLNGFDLQGWQ